MNCKITFKLACISIIASSSLYGYSLRESVDKVLATNPEILAEKNNQEAYRKYIDERKAKYLPNIDVDGRIEKSNIENKYDTQTTSLQNGSTQEDGYNVGIALNQMLYDGNLTPSQVEEAKHNYWANKYQSNEKINNVVLNTITAYNGMVQYKELLRLSESMIETNNENLKIAKDKESISGEVLETYQVDSRLNYVKEQYLEQRDLENSRKSSFKRYIGVNPDGTECRAQIDLSKIPATLQEAVEVAVLKNNQILEQIEKVKAQREVIAQKDAAFLPNLSLELKALTDNDLATDENGLENQAYGRINLEWNLYNGGADYAVSKQAELFLAEQKQRLDAITNEIVESVKVTYDRFRQNQERIAVLKKYVVANENIVKVYKSEFEAGTRTFVDILDAQTTLYEAQKSLVNREFELYSNYYSLLNSMSLLQDTIANSNDVCSAEVMPSTYQEFTDNTTTTDSDSTELNTLLGDDTAQTQDVEVVDTVSQTPVSSSTSGLAFLDAPRKSYTINITTTKGLNSANKFVRNNGLDSSQAFTYEFGPSMGSAKVIYGIYDSVAQAKRAMDDLPSSVLAQRPYIDNMSKHKKLYRKYH